MFSGYINRTDKPLLHKSNDAAEVEIHVSGAFFSLRPSKAIDSFFYKETSSSVIIVEARLDNRQELVTQFKMDHRFHDPVHDAELTVMLYQRFGKECVQNLLGKFLIVDYHIHKRQLSLIRDHCDVNGLYYYKSNQVFVFASTIQRILDHPWVPKHLNFEKVVDSEIISQKTSKDGSTFYQDIEMLYPAHILEMDPNHFKKERYWFPEHIEIDNSISFQDAAEQMRSLFFDAVAARIQTSGGVASMMSGGLDSGSVANVAASLLALESKTLHTYSHIPFYDLDNLNIPKNRPGDERPYIEASLIQHNNIIPHFINSPDMGILEGLRKFHEMNFTPLHGVGNAFWAMDIYQHVQEEGHSVLLSGGMGNATISFQGHLYALRLRDLSLFQAGKKLLRPAYHTLTSLNKPPKKWQEYSYLHAKFADDFRIEERIKQGGRPVAFSKIKIKSHREKMLNLLKIGRNGRSLGGHNIARYYGFAFRDPTADRRLIEFLLSLPNSYFVNGKGESKLLIKKAMKGILPDKVLFQKGKGLQGADVMMRVQSDIPEIESIINNFKTNFYKGEMYDKPRMLHDLARLKAFKLTPYQTHYLLSSVGIMEFLNNK